ncbi:ABR193Wp [Eremothecium gossypii ATCC 10895]|uniref:Peptide-N(4)-(N-acetyl-beta-glucosaminyl)asparagine amidase n=1 Tax=Eremothecium gossypii (strain ATCC 10895 / CBS 109.51 / FGSC 9923 / NRRL Y-1056) TaxID=284811 RepID=PNG1_EREGS|nr:ABR193Wp [Eremothecium gossypii ATCC 10895]Q75D29.1 RecName: Full=Peptide-N(4)-(N-acetyl-beta-glucosaminyl)asparagine amidase; Short=PNGase; AltName: Full=Peptide:N-glycanase 1 [Eremothecium gossypii ATCC 10895]AAS50966.1 ABR193Wp [Eremothecium gossypii ATCC 10895]AEY95255.1 FABR193Wp [Eremothecium gossypii FDAG1]
MRVSEDTSTKEVFERVAADFLQLYKRCVLAQTREVRSSDRERCEELVRRNALARELCKLHQTLCFVYENDALYGIVLDALDLEGIYGRVEEGPGADDYQDRLVQELLRYFKDEFFTWCDKPLCARCGTAKKQAAVGHGKPTVEEARYRCTVVELFRCEDCGDVARFPRYNDPLKLLETRTGRCGEWCNLFMLILRSFGIEARYTWNREDHVWCEVYSNALKRWVHVDSCEKSFDEPHIYSVNWNKAMSYVIAFSNRSVKDVSRRYIVRNRLPRDQIDEDDLQFLTKYLTKLLRLQLPDEERYLLHCRDELEAIDLLGSKTAPMEIPPAAGAAGRQSGSADWKRQRGEDGR